MPDGRSLAYAEQGDPAAYPVLYLHGFAGSRLETHPDGTIPVRAAARVIAVDRPGIGRSDPAGSYTPLDVAADLGSLAGSLGLERFAVLGFSWGGAYALACGRELPGRVATVGLVNAMTGWLVGPGAAREVSRLFNGLAPWINRRWALRPFLARTHRKLRRHPEAVIAEVIASSSEGDRRVLEDASIRAMLIEKSIEAFRQGVGGLVDDTQAAGRPWGFHPHEIETPVLIWQGEQDTEILPAMARQTAAGLPRAAASYFADEGHLLVLARWERILTELVSASTR